MRVNGLHNIHAVVMLTCCECGSRLYPIGIDKNPYYCRKCDKAWWLEFRECRIPIEELKTVVGFPKEAKE